MKLSEIDAKYHLHSKTTENIARAMSASGLDARIISILADGTAHKGYMRCAPTHWITVDPVEDCPTIENDLP